MDIEAFLGNFSLSSSSNKSPPSPKPSSKILKSPSTTQLDTSITTDRSHNNNNDGTITKIKDYRIVKDLWIYLLLEVLLPHLKEVILRNQNL